jgi:hypothetical protein
MGLSFLSKKACFHRFVWSLQSFHCWGLYCERVYNRNPSRLLSTWLRQYPQTSTMAAERRSLIKDDAQPGPVPQGQTRQLEDRPLQHH